MSFKKKELEISYHAASGDKGIVKSPIYMFDNGTFFGRSTEESFPIVIGGLILKGESNNETVKLLKLLDPNSIDFDPVYWNTSLTAVAGNIPTGVTRVYAGNFRYEPFHSLGNCSAMFKRELFTAIDNIVNSLESEPHKDFSLTNIYADNFINSLKYGKLDAYSNDGTGAIKISD